MRAAPSDTSYLWFLGNPGVPTLVGELNLVMSRRGVSLKYAESWIKAGFPLSEDLPLTDLEHLPQEKDTAAGAVDDARPDRWGERVIRLLDRPPRLSLLEYLYYAGDDRFGALGVSRSEAVYQPREIGPLPKIADVDAVHEVVRRVLAQEPVDARQKRLIVPGVTMGGARPKALFQLNGEEWVLKFAEEDRPAEPLMEHAAMTLAAQAGITVAETRPIPFKTGIALAIRRFDRVAGRRLHALSANVALRAAGAELSYPNLALLLRRRGPVELHRKQMRELFRRLVFNILIDNTDDHEKNHVILVREDQQYVLAPAFDVLPIGQSLGCQSLVVGERGAESTIENALSAAIQYWLTPQDALTEARQVARVVQGWQPHFAAQGLPQTTLEELAQHIDRPFLQDQRQALR
ncbi:type II toxin-antitoxin system HipA family toxin [Denitratisoma sp. DHT3]|uniref:type II toxin-antitoxin system HipA family toxin n=1 Tax=Denitratisoma sp. DHT3 TaxID=1981880 RepID=UPI001C965463|nr:HipA domain-containing protein [Denitratisoma sp. DHT3]